MLTFIIFILILGIIILIHELGHFLFAKLSGVYVYEFSIGMGKKIFSKKPKGSETEYNIRLIPIGGFVVSLKYAVNKTGSLFKIMLETVKSLFTGGVSVNDLSGPVGIYNIVGTQAKNGVESLLYLLAYLSINVGVINLIPFPAFDGGHILFLIIEKIIGKPVPEKVESTITGIGFILLMILMIYITGHDIINLFH